MKVPGNTLVLKFGGTSLGTEERLNKVAYIIKQTQAIQNQDSFPSRLLIVVSAISPGQKSGGTTSKLMEAAKLIVEPQQHGKTYKTSVTEIEEAHLKLAMTIQNDHIRQDLERDIRSEIQFLRLFLDAAYTIGEVSIRSYDVIIGMGERLAARMLSAFLKDQVGIVGP
jgi:aspartate kinase